MQSHKVLLGELTDGEIFAKSHGVCDVILVITGSVPTGVEKELLLRPDPPRAFACYGHNVPLEVSIVRSGCAWI